MTPKELLAAIERHPDELTPRLMYADWVAEFGTEADWQAYLDLHPDHHDMRVRFADWLEERGDERAEGYRALAANGLNPCSRYQGNHLAPKEGAHWWRADGKLHDLMDTEMPADWYDATVQGRKETGWRWTGWDTRREAEDAAALAFAKLPAERRAELLAEKGTVAA